MRGETTEKQCFSAAGDTSLESLLSESGQGRSWFRKYFVNQVIHLRTLSRCWESDHERVCSRCARCLGEILMFTPNTSSTVILSQRMLLSSLL